jgi:hypothetical protein
MELFATANAVHGGSYLLNSIYEADGQEEREILFSTAGG